MTTKDYPASEGTQSESAGEDAYSRIYPAEAAQYYRKVFDLFVEEFSKTGRVVTNRAHSWIGFTVPLEEVPHLVLGPLWDSKWAMEQSPGRTRSHAAVRFNTPILGWFCLYNYSHQAWRITNHGMRGNIPTLPSNVAIRRSALRSLCVTGQTKIELSFHESELGEIDFLGLRSLILEVQFGCPVTWPVAPWTKDNWHYSWTEKGLRYMNARHKRLEEEKTNRQRRAA
jgi:hypothetical protein